MLTALAGANLIYGAGMLETAMTIDYAQLVIDAEFADLIEFCVGGVAVDDATMALDVIHEVGPFSDFLSHDDTLRHMRVQSRPALLDRRVREDWVADGSRDVADRALEQARRILATHGPTPLPAGATEEMRAVIAKAERDLGCAGVLSGSAV